MEKFLRFLILALTFIPCLLAASSAGAGPLQTSLAGNFDGFWGGFGREDIDTLSFKVRRNNIHKMRLVITGVCTTRDTGESYINTFVLSTSETADFLLNRGTGKATGMFDTPPGSSNALTVNMEINLRRKRAVVAAITNDPAILSPCEATETYRLRKAPRH